MVYSRWKFRNKSIKEEKCSKDTESYESYMIIMNQTSCRSDYSKVHQDLLLTAISQ